MDQKVQALEQRRSWTRPTDIQEQIQALDQKVRILARQRELDQEAAATAAKAQPKLTMGASGFTVSSADSNFVFSLKGVLQVDSRTFFNDAHQEQRRISVAPGAADFSGTLYRDFDFRFTPDFGGFAAGATIFTTPMEITVTRRGRNCGRANSKRRKDWSSCRRT